MADKIFSNLIQDILSSSKSLYDFLDLLPENRFNLYFKLDIGKINILYQLYISNIEFFIKNCSIVKTQEKSFEKLLTLEIENIYNNNNLIYEIIYSIFLEITKDKSRMRDLKSLLKSNYRSLQILENMVYSYQNFQYDLDLDKIRPISYKDLQFGDIVLSVRKKVDFWKNPVTWLIHKVTHSYVTHATIYYDRDNYNYYFFDTTSNYSDFFKKKVLYHKFKINYSKQVYGLVLRYKSPLTFTQKEKINNYFKSNYGIKYGLLKALRLAIILELFNHISSYKKLENKILNKSLYCSESVAEAYETAGIILSIKEDNATVTPVDLLNTNKLEIIGYIDHTQNTNYLKHENRKNRDLDFKNSL